jgi:hypothetical protein
MTSSSRNRSRPNIRGNRHSLDRSLGSLDIRRSRDRSHGKRFERRALALRFRCRKRRTCPG